jgi:hypothetical protein
MWGGGYSPRNSPVWGRSWGARRCASASVEHQRTRNVLRALYLYSELCSMQAESHPGSLVQPLHIRFSIKNNGAKYPRLTFVHYVIVDERLLGRLAVVKAASDRHYQAIWPCYWSHVEYIIMVCHSIGRTQSIFPRFDILLAARRVYSYRLACSLSHTACIRTAVCYAGVYPHELV